MPVFLMRQANGNVLILKNRTKTTQWFWKFNDDGFRGWSVPFRDCFLTDGLWLHAYSAADNSGVSITIFVKLILNRCDNNLRDVFKSGHLCDEKTTQVSNNFFFLIFFIPINYEFCLIQNYIKKVKLREKQHFLGNFLKNWDLFKLLISDLLHNLSFWKIGPQISYYTDEKCNFLFEGGKF